jgi:class 3 adenylate cyclase
MKLKKFEDYIIKEALGGEEIPKRSERVLTQAQKNHEESPETNGKGSSSVMSAMVFTDVVGSSKLWSDDPYTMARQLEEHHKLVDELSGKYKGWIVKTIGDAFMVYFEPSSESLINALRFSKEIIKQEIKYNLRVGICSGNMEEKTYKIQNVNLRDFFGNAVNTASRMESKVSEAGGMAFTSVKPISQNVIANIEEQIGRVSIIPGEDLDLKGVTIDKAYKIQIK